MSEPKGHWQEYDSSAVLDLTFAMRTRGNTEANVKSTALAGRRCPEATFTSSAPASPLPIAPCCNEFSISVAYFGSHDDSVRPYPESCNAQGPKGQRPAVHLA